MTLTQTQYVESQALSWRSTSLLPNSINISTPKAAEENKRDALPCPKPLTVTGRNSCNMCRSQAGKFGQDGPRFLLTIPWWENVLPEAGCDMVLCFELLNTRGWAREGAWDGSRLEESFSIEAGVFPSRTARSILVEGRQDLDEWWLHILALNIQLRLQLKCSWSSETQSLEMLHLPKLIDV